jgi:hypothetical protein
MFLGIFKKVWFLWALSIIVNIIALLLVYFKIGGQPEKTIVLHYNVILGVDNYGQANKLYIIPAAAFFLCSLNYIFFRLTKMTRMFYSPLLAGMSLIIQLVLLFALILIIRAN